ncbi:MAG: HAD family hydrolase [Butyricicoccus sp.]
MMIKAFVSDMDGTLLTPESKISPRTAAAIRMAEANNIRMIVATGRARNTAYPLLQSAGVECSCVLLNGAECRSASGEIIFCEPITGGAPEQILQELMKRNIDFEINTDIGDFSTNTIVCDTAIAFPSLTEFWQQRPQIKKIFVFDFDTQKIKETKEWLKNSYPLSITSSEPWCIEITAQNAQKSTMLERMLSDLKIKKEEVIVFGDGENDETMFQMFPHSRAVANAVPTILAMAEKRIESNADDGVAREIERILGGNNHVFFQKEEGRND